MSYLLTSGYGKQTLTGIRMLAGAVFAVRVVGVVADKGRSASYTKLTIPTKVAFVVLAVGARLIG